MGRKESKIVLMMKAITSCSKLRRKNNSRVTSIYSGKTQSSHYNADIKPQSSLSCYSYDQIRTHDQQTLQSTHSELKLSKAIEITSDDTGDTQRCVKLMCISVKYIL